nr:hypothetical protein CFP56_48976 [Quercus suber]
MSSGSDLVSLSFSLTSTKSIPVFFYGIGANESPNACAKTVPLYNVVRIYSSAMVALSDWRRCSASRFPVALSDCCHCSASRFPGKHSTLPISVIAQLLSQKRSLLFLYRL